MKEILWFRRDLRISDSALLHYARGEVFPIFIFDKNILDKLAQDDKRVSFLYKSVLNLKKKLQSLGLDLAIFYGKPLDIFQDLKKLGFEKILCSVDFDSYAIKRDKEVAKILPLSRYLDSFLLNPSEHLKKDGTPYRMFTPFFNSLCILHQSHAIEVYKHSADMKLFSYDYTKIPSLKQMNFIKQELPIFLSKTPFELLKKFALKISNYEKDRDYFSLDATSHVSVFLRFGVISAKEVFNFVQSLHVKNKHTFIKELFWREFYNYLLYHFPHSEFQNFKNIKVKYKNDERDFKAWCEGKTGVYIIDAAMREFNKTGLMHNRLRMLVASFLTKNLLIDWRWGEKYFSQKLLDYEASTNIGSWQWAASTGVDSVPYFRIFNPYTQAKKFDKEALFIKRVLPHLKDVPAKILNEENQDAIVDIKSSRLRAIASFKAS